MKVAFFGTKPYDREFFEQANQHFQQELHFFDARLNRETVELAKEHDAICIFVNDPIDRNTIVQLSKCGIRCIALRCAGFNHVDLAAAKEHRIAVVRVPLYSPYAIAEHALALMLALNRKLYRAYNRVRDQNFSLDGLLGFDMHEKVVGIIGMGAIGSVLAKILHGFGCSILGFDVTPNQTLEEAYEMQFVSLEEIYRQCDIISLHCPLNTHTHRLINAQAIAQMKAHVMLINTSRGGLLDTSAVIEALKEKKIGFLGIDVYEQEEELFFEDLSDEIIPDDLFGRLLSFPNVLITGHQAFFTREAMQTIANTTLENIQQVMQTGRCQNCVE